MSLEEQLVRRFYEQAWNQWDDEAADVVLSATFRFRGSLGTEIVGRDAWRAYRDRIRRAVPDFHNEIVDLVTSPGRAAARLMFTGHHHGVLLGRRGRGLPIAYAGAAFLECSDTQLLAVWVLGDSTPCDDRPACDAAMPGRGGRGEVVAGHRPGRPSAMPYVESGEFNRDTAYIQDRITRDGRDGLDRRAAAPVARPAV